MKNTIITTVIFLVFISCQNKAENTQKTSAVENDKKENLQETPDNEKIAKDIFFVGYHNKLPVFYNRERHTLFISPKTGSLEFFKQVDILCSVEYINDNWLLLSKGKELIMKNLADESLSRGKVLGINKDIGAAVCNSDLSAIVFVEMYSADIKIYFPNEDIIKDINAEGFAPYFINDSVFYYSYSDFGIKPTMSIYNIFSDKSSVLVEGIYEDPIIYSPDGRYIVGSYDEIKEDNSQVIYDIKNKNYKLVDRGEFFSHWCYYSYQENAFVFYTYEDFKTKVVPLP